MNNSKTAPEIKATSQMREPYKDTYFLRHLTFTRQDMAGRYALDAGYFANIPENLQVQHTFKQGIRSTWVMTSMHDDGSCRIFTGIRPAGVQDWYYGDIPLFGDGKVTKRLLLVEFSPDKYQFRLYLMNSYPPTKSRRTEIKRIIGAIVNSRNPFTHESARSKQFYGVNSCANPNVGPDTVQNQETLKTP